MQPILIASVVAVLLIGTYLVLKKKQSSTKGSGRVELQGDRLTPADSGTWVLTLLSDDPCGNNNSRYMKVNPTWQVTVDGKGDFTGVPDPTNVTPFKEGLFFSSTKNGGYLHIGGVESYLPVKPYKNKVLLQPYNLYVPGQLSFQPLSQYKKVCGNPRLAAGVV